MTKADLAVLERAFGREIAGGILQTTSKRAKKLADAGMLRFVRRRDTSQRFVLTWEGYELTESGRLAYCMTCTDAEGVEG